MPYDLFEYWRTYLAVRQLEHTKTDYALAQLTSVVYNVLGSDENHKCSFEDFLIKFKTKEQIEKEENERDQRNLEWTMLKLKTIQDAQQKVKQKAKQTDKSK